MSDVTSIDKSELVRQGMGSYWDAKFAMHTFEESIQKAAQELLESNLDGISQSCGQANGFSREKIWLHPPERDCPVGQVAIGAALEWDCGFRLGIGWRRAIGDGNLEPVALVTIRVGAAYKKDKMLSAFIRAQSINPKDKISISGSTGAPHEVAIWSHLSEQPSLGDVQLAPRLVLEPTISWSNYLGGLQAVVYGAG